MKKLFGIALLTCSMSSFSAGMVYSCMNESSSNDTCRVSVLANTYDEILVAEIGPTRLEWCNGWVQTGCKVTGPQQLLSGEFTVRQLIDSGLKFYVKRETDYNQWICRLN